MFTASQKESTDVDKYKRSEIRVIFYEQTELKGQAVMYEVSNKTLKLAVEDISKHVKWEKGAQASLVLIY